MRTKLCRRAIGVLLAGTALAASVGQAAPMSSESAPVRLDSTVGDVREIPPWVCEARVATRAATDPRAINSLPPATLVLCR